jgi:hypothetical protein
MSKEYNLHYIPIMHDTTSPALSWLALPSSMNTNGANRETVLFILVDFIASAQLTCHFFTEVYGIFLS